MTLEDLHQKTIDPNDYSGSKLYHIPGQDILNFDFEPQPASKYLNHVINDELNFPNANMLENMVFEPQDDEMEADFYLQAYGGFSKPKTM